MVVRFLTVQREAPAVVVILVHRADHPAVVQPIKDTQEALERCLEILAQAVAAVLMQ
jgi:hypothetical protein